MSVHSLNKQKIN